MYVIGPAVKHCCCCYPSADAGYYVFVPESDLFSIMKMEGTQPSAHL